MNIAFERINSQIKEADKKISLPKINEKEAETIENIEIYQKDTPLNREDLKNLLMEELKALEPELYLESTEKCEKKFEGIEDFVVWYLEHKNKFSENQNIALSTLVKLNEMINIGCGCRRSARANASNSHFKTFWQKNAQTDLPAKVLEVGNFSKVVFATPECGEFLSI